MKLYYDKAFAAPLGRHVMPIHKFELIAECLRFDTRVVLRSPDPISESDLLAVHTHEYVMAVKTGSPRMLAESQKFPWSESLYRSVLLTNGAVLAAAGTALDGRISGALASGFHHAHADHGEGFCTFNGLVIASQSLRAQGRIHRAAVVDLDLHYGNGTASLCASRPWLDALSIYGNDYHANTPYRDVTVRRHADGSNHRSIALRPTPNDGQALQEALHENLPWLLRSGRPDLILFQAGADPLRDDPYSPLNLDHEDLYLRDAIVFEFARANAIPIAWVLAGGYAPDVRQVVKVHLNTVRASFEVFGPASG